jgi:aspartate oxidase
MCRGFVPYRIFAFKTVSQNFLEQNYTNIKAIKETSMDPITKLRQKISTWEKQKERCPSFYDETLCIIRLNQMIQKAKIKIKALQTKQENSHMDIRQQLNEIFGKKKK